MTNRTRLVRGPRLCAALVLVVLGGGVWIPPVHAESSVPVSWNAHLRSTAYFFQEVSPDGAVEQDRTPIYEQYDLRAGGLLNGKLDFRFSGRYATDPRLDRAIPAQNKWYTGYARLRLDPGRTELRAGRLFLREGTYFATLDGGWASVGLHPRLRVTAWGGASAPASREFEFGDDFRFGTRAVFKATQKMRLSAWVAGRDLEGDLLSLPVGGELIARPVRPLRTVLRGSFDAEREEIERIDLLLNWRRRRDLPDFNLQYSLRSQDIDGASWWEQFREDLHTIQLLRGSVRWTNPRGIGGELQGFLSAVDDRNTSQIGGAFLMPHLRVGAALLDGDAGEQLRGYGDANWRVNDRFYAAAGASFVEYALVQDPTSNEQRDLTTWFGRVEYAVVPGAELTVEFQALDNPFYDNDVRLLVGLDLAAGRGASRSGVGGAR